MPTIDNDYSVTLNLSSNGERWIFSEDASVYTLDGTAGINFRLDPSSDAQAGTIRIDGIVSLVVPSDSSNGSRALNMSPGVSAMVSKRGFLGGFFGILGESVVDISNAGIITGTFAGIGLASGFGDNVVTDITNSGVISGRYGIYVYAEMGVDLTNEKGGTITGAATAVYSTISSLASSVTNHGTIQVAGSGNGSVIAVVLGNEADTVTNDGLIRGGAFLGDGADTFDNRHGTVKGLIRGGAGDDTLIVDDAKYILTENAGEGDLDSVRSSVSYTLSDNVEQLVLTGSKNIKGTGTDGENILRGNGGDNKLSGLGGHDVLWGGKGNDMLTGGDDFDMFGFKTGDGKDTIADFEIELDAIDLSKWKAIGSMAELKSHASEKSGDLRISAGGDTLVIKDFEKQDLADAVIYFDTPL